MSRFVNPRPQYLDSSGDPLPGGLLYFYESGTTTGKTTYADVNQSTANTNPVVLDADGRVPSVFFDGVARVVLRTAASVLVWDLDPVGAGDLTGPFTQWSSEITYGVGAIVVLSNGDLYRSLVAANTDNEPSVSAAFWEKLEFIRVWNANVTYALNATTKGSNGLFYVSLANGNLGNDPISDAVNWGPPVDLLVLGLGSGGEKTSGFTAAVNTRYWCNFAASGTITLPASATAGDAIMLSLSGASIAYTVDPNGLNMNGATDSIVFPSNNTITLTYNGAAQGWV